MSGHKVKIVARLRPLLPGELEDNSVQVYHASDNSTASLGKGQNACGSFITVANPRNPAQAFKFPLTSCYDQDSTQEEIFKNDVQPMIDMVYSGVTVTIFAYGVTSSGKTHTIQGTKAEPGIIPRVVQAMFCRKTHPEYDHLSTSVSYMEIYKDEVYDLLVTRDNAPKLPVRENHTGQVFVAKLTSMRISSVEEFDAIYSKATKHRSTGSTNLNHASSRSHAVLTIEVKMTNSVDHKILTGKINLVDLAGSENNKITGNDPSRMAESSAINKSLSVLGQVVHALNQGAPRIPYRNSKLTRILQDALGGSSVGLLICNLAPGIKFRQDTLNTLNFAVRTKNIENKPVINERDSRAQPEPHFAAVQPPVPKLLPAVLQPISRASGRPSLIPNPRSSLASSGQRSSLGANPVRTRGVLRASRVSAFSGATMGFQSFATASIAGRKMGGDETDSKTTVGLGTPALSEKDIDDRIAKAVEMEVARRLQERDREKAEEQRTRAEQNEKIENTSKSPEKEPRKMLPPGVLTPLLKRHQDLDDELKSRLQELEKKFERDSNEAQLADVLSPVSRKKTGRAYVALARAHSEKGNLPVALELYRKAENYVPDNLKLKDRIIEIEWAVKNNAALMLSPKKEKEKKKSKGRKKSMKGFRLRQSVDCLNTSDAPMDVDGWQDEDEGKEGVASRKDKESRRTEHTGTIGFGLEVTNSPIKRSVTERVACDEGQDMEDMGMPLKRRKSETKGWNMGLSGMSFDDGVPPTAVKVLRNT